MDQRRWDQIEELLQKALDLESVERLGFLEKACNGDTELRHAVETLLNREEQARSFIETPAIAHDPFRTEATHSSFIGQSISHYRIESLIGTGGMGEVYQAQDENLKRTVALKILPAAFTADPDRVRRFEQEAFAASKLNHPNIITIFEIVHSDDAHFIAIEYVEGKTLRQLLTDSAAQRSRQLSVEQAIDIAIQVAGALKAAHTAWIIHRDIKPENIMVRGDGLVKVLDFGIAKLGEGGAEIRGEAEIDTPTAASLRHNVAQSLTVPGAVMGTASYMSPEQATGEELDGRTDVFSLGVVLSEMVTGERLFTGATRTEALRAVRTTQEPLPPAYRSDRAPKELERIIRKAVRRDRQERYASAGEILDDLTALTHRLENRASRRMVKLSALAVVSLLSLIVIAALASRSEVWDEQILRDGHTAAVRRAAFSPDGRLLVSIGEDKQVIVWDFARRARLASFNDHTDWVAAVAFAPDGKRFATAGYDRTVIVWDAVKLTKETVLRDHRDIVLAVAFSPDGRVLVAANGAGPPEDRTTLLWRVGSWEQFARIPLGSSEIQSLLFPFGSSRMIYHHDTRPFPNTWDVSNGQALGNQFDAAWAGQNAALSSDGTRLAAVTGEGDVIFVDFNRRRLLSRERAHQDNGRATAFSPDGRLVATGAENIILWDAETRRRITTIDYPSIVWSTVFSPDGRWLVTTHGDGAIRVWDVINRQRVVGFNEHDGAVRAVAWAPDGRRFASAGEDRTVMIWSAETGRREMLLAGHSTRVTGVAFAPDNQTLASVDLDGAIILWDLTQQREQLRFSYPRGQTVGYCLALSPDGLVVATSHGAYETATGTQLADFGGRVNSPFNPSAIYGLAFSSDGLRLAAAQAQSRPFVCDTATWRVEEQADHRPRQFISVSFAPDGKDLVTGEDGGVVQLWKAQPLSPIAVIGQHAARIKSVAFSPDGNKVASAGDDKMIALWDVSSRRLITRIGLHTAPVYAIAFSPDGRRLVSGEHDRSVRLYTRHRTLWGFRLD